MTASIDHPLSARYRPQRFSELVGNDLKTEIIRRSVLVGSVRSAYSFEGSHGCGKTSTARIFARAIVCESANDGEPCNECESCVSALAGKHPDILEIDAAAQNNVDRIRRLIATLHYAPVLGKRRIVILDEVHMLSAASGNTLLKTLEEPPPHVVFVLCTTDAHKVLDTVLSRCCRFQFRALGVADIVERLMFIADNEGLELKRDTARLIAQHARGALRDAVNILDQASQVSKTISHSTVAGLLETVDAQNCVPFVEAISEHKAGEAISWCSKMYDSGKSGVEILRALLETLTESVYIQQGVKVEGVNESDLLAYRKIGGVLTLPQLLELMAIIRSGLRDIRDGANPLSVLAVVAGFPSTQLSGTSYTKHESIETAMNDKPKTPNPIALLRKHFSGQRVKIAEGAG